MRNVPSPHSEQVFAHVIAWARADARVLGVVLIGSRATESMKTVLSDYDFIVIVDTDQSIEDIPASYRFEDCDCIVISLAAFGRYAMPQHPESWNRYAFVHARVLHDSADGRVAELVASKARLSEQEAKNLSRGALNAYINSCYRSLKNARDGLVLESRLDAAESIPHLLTSIFALEGRLRPYNKYLLWELKHRPSLQPEWQTHSLLPRLEAILTSGDLAVQRSLFGDVERVAYTKGCGEVFSAWGARLNLMRTENTPANSRKWRATQRVLQFINHKHHMQYGLTEELAGGNQSGAYLVRTPDGEEAVLKWSSAKSWLLQVERAAPLITQARALGWPTPAWLAWGATPSGYPYEIQEFASGDRAKVLNARLAHAALKVIQLQAGVCPQTEQDWSAYDWEVVFADKSNFLSTVAASSPAGNAFVDLLRRRTAKFRDVQLPADDLVHGDFNPDNILLLGNEVNAVVDAEAMGKGSRFHDLSTLLAFGALWSGETDAVSILLEYALEFARPGELEVTLATNLAALLAFLIKRGADPTAAIHAASALILQIA